MARFTFTTNIKCGGCIATVKPHLDNLTGIKSWSVDTTTPDKLLTVEAENVSAKEIEKAVEAAGYRIVVVNG